jgi:hypothetical protein
MPLLSRIMVQFDAFNLEGDQCVAELSVMAVAQRGAGVDRRRQGNHGRDGPSWESPP